MGELALRKRMVRTARDSELLKKPKKRKDEIKKSIECKRKDISKIRKKIRERGGGKRMKAKLEERMRKIEKLRRSNKPQLESIINLTENQTGVRTYNVTCSLDQNIPNLILNTIFPVIEMQMRVIYSFSCSIYQGRNEIVQYHKTWYLHEPKPD